MRYANRTTEARACLSRAKNLLNASRNLKKEIKEGMISAVERLFQLVKESESGKVRSSGETIEPGKASKDLTPTSDAPTELMKQLMEDLRSHNKALEECQQHTRALS